jgi:hypothetical protein
VLQYRVCSWHLLEIVSQARKCSRKLLSDSANGVAQNPGNVGDREVVKISKKKDLLFVAGKTRQGRENQSGIVFGGRIECRSIGDSRDEDEAFFRAGAVGGCAAGYGEKPSAEGIRVAEPGELVIGLYEGVLRDVLGGVVVAEDGPGSGMDVAFISPNKAGVSIAMTGKYLAYKIVVGLHGLGFQSHHIHIDETQRYFAA